MPLLTKEKIKRNEHLKHEFKELKKIHTRDYKVFAILAEKYDIVPGTVQRIIKPIQHGARGGRTVKQIRDYMKGYNEQYRNKS